MFVDSIVGFASLIVGIAGLIKSDTVPNSSIRIHLQNGKNGAGLSDSQGEIPSIYVKDTSDRSIGHYNSYAYNTIQSDNYWNHDMRTQLPSEMKTLDFRMEYGRTGKGNAGKKGPLNDGMCLAYLSWTPDNAMFNHEARSGAISGDLFYFCGYSWYKSGKSIGGKEIRCGWMDGDNSNGNSVHGMFLNTDILGSGYIEGYSRSYPNVADICYWGVSFSGGSGPYRKRSTPAGEYGNRAYVTSEGGAIELCDSPTSWGPSMLSLEQNIFCDMATKTKIPVCKSDKDTACVKYGKSSKKRSIERTIVAKNVSDISFPFYELEYFATTDINGTIIDDGSRD